MTQLVNAVSEGEPQAWNHLIPLVYAELKRIASRQLKRGGNAAGMQTTALVHSLYERLLASGMNAESRHHFYALCAKAMRHHLIDLSRRSAAQKRGGLDLHFSLQDQDLPGPDDDAALLKLGEFLERIEVEDPRAVQAFELVHLVGQEPKEVADALGVSLRTVQRDMKRVRALFLYELEIDSGSAD
ncbi:MAG: ECF-type sigma factor [Xanthomonadales bacterium]|nr:ECF-type sigma factor [Xanthomonadales bacterium]